MRKITLMIMLLPVMMMIKLTMKYYDAKNAKMHSSVFSFVPVVARSAVCRCFPTFGGFEANKASEGEHLVQTLPARKHCQQKIIASKKSLPTKNHCQQKIIASKKNYCQQKHYLQKTFPARKHCQKKTLPAENHCQQILNSAFEKMAC